MCLKRKMTQLVAQGISDRSQGKTFGRWKGVRLWCYACPRCGWWHMTSQPQRGR